MKNPGKLRIFLLALVIPGAVLAGVALFLKVEALWLFGVYTFVFTLAALLFAYLFSPGWFPTTRRGMPSRRPPRRRY